MQEQQEDGFNLLHQPWIPCVSARGEPCEVGLLELFRRAHEIRDLAEPSPLARVTMVRMLLAVLYRSHVVDTTEEWQDLWDQPDIANAAVTYLEKWGDRFDLFSTRFPFYQRTDIDTGGKLVAVTKLSHEFTAGNNKLLFDHSRDDDPPAFTPARAARLLITAQGWSIGGGIAAGGRPRFTSASLPKAAALLPLGENLRDTLLLNLVRTGALMQSPRRLVRRDSEDRPAWERAGEAQVDERPCEGPADYLTWQFRYLRLQREPDGMVRFMTYSQGEKIAVPSGAEPQVDPLHAYTRGNKEEVIPRGINPDRAVWRDVESLFAQTASSRECFTAPALHELAHNSTMVSRPIPDPVPVLVAGIAVPGGQPPPDLWCVELFRIPPRLVIDDDAKDILREAVETAKDVAKLLGTAVWVYANTYLKMNDDKSGDPKAVRALTDALCREVDYWAALEAPFHRFLPSLGSDDDAPRQEWRRAIRLAAIRAFEASLASQDETGRHHRAANAARAAFYNPKKGLHSIIPKEDTADGNNETAA